MKQSQMLVALAYGVALASAGAAYAGAPQPDQRQGDFVHVCQGGPRKALTCTVATENTDCPRSHCVVQTLSKPIPGTLTIIAHDTVTDWASSDTGNSALTVLLEVKAGGPEPFERGRRTAVRATRIGARAAAAAIVQQHGNAGDRRRERQERRDRRPQRRRFGDRAALQGEAAVSGSGLIASSVRTRHQPEDS
jgi:hypothetical protein